MRTRSGYPHETEHSRLHFGSNRWAASSTNTGHSLTQHPASRQSTFSLNFQGKHIPFLNRLVQRLHDILLCTGDGELRGSANGPIRWPVDRWRFVGSSTGSSAPSLAPRAHIMQEIADRFYSSGQLHTVSYFPLIPVASQSCEGGLDCGLHPSPETIPPTSAV